MPAGPAPAPGALPSRQVGGGGLPEDEVHRVFLERRDLDPRAGDHVVDRPARELAVALVRPHPEEDMARLLIGMAPGDQVRDHRDHLADILGRARLGRGRQVAERRHVLVVPADRLVGALADQVFQRPRVAGILAALRLGVDLVVDVGEVPDIGDVVRPVDMAQKPEEHVEDDHGARIAQVSAVIDRWAADIHPHVRRIDRREVLLRPGPGVVEPDPRHGQIPRARVPAAGLPVSHARENRRTARLTSVSR